MHGAGNDYVYVDASRETLPNDLPALARAVSDRHFGIGGDGLILVHPPTDAGRADVRMQMFNLDGSEGEMCGNGIRCVAKFAVDEGLVSGDSSSLRVETATGVRSIDVVRDEAGNVAGAAVDMGRAAFGIDAVRAEANLLLAVRDHLLRPEGLRHEVVLVSTGNAHAVAFVDDLEAIDLPVDGPRLSAHSAFPKEINAHFSQVLSRDRIRVAHWERGSGPTLACGTGACSVLAAAVLLGLADTTATVEVPGGALTIEVDPEHYGLRMTGPAVTVFQGRWGCGA